MVNYKVNTENLSLDAYKKNAYKKISSVVISISMDIKWKYRAKLLHVVNIQSRGGEADYLYWDCS